MRAHILRLHRLQLQSRKCETPRTRPALEASVVGDSPFVWKKQLGISFRNNHMQRSLCARVYIRHHNEAMPFLFKGKHVRHHVHMIKCTRFKCVSEFEPTCALLTDEHKQHRRHLHDADGPSWSFLFLGSPLPGRRPPRVSAPSRRSHLCAQMLFQPHVFRCTLAAPRVCCLCCTSPRGTVLSSSCKSPRPPLPTLGGRGLHLCGGCCCVRTAPDALLG